MSYIFPKPLKKGDTVGIIAPCGCLREPERIELGVNRLQESGFKVKLSKHLFDTKRYMAGDDNIRAQEVHSFFADNEVDCILCARGGFGAIRIVDKLDYDLIRQNPKIFCGYSDVTALSVIMLKHAGLVTFSSPMLSGDWGKETLSDFTIGEFFNTISGKPCEYDLTGSSDACVSGIAWGGNLTTLASLCGREFIPDEDFIFIIEDVNEPVYKIDRALTQLCGLKDFKKNIKGLVCGEFSGVENNNWLNELLNEFCTGLKIPLWQDLKLGHGEKKITFPIGGKCEVCNNKIFFKQRG